MFQHGGASGLFIKNKILFNQLGLMCPAGVVAFLGLRAPIKRNLFKTRLCNGEQGAAIDLRATTLANWMTPNAGASIAASQIVCVHCGDTVE
ncbi:hypothetical protein CCGE525_01455 [Rhizobium jaguaris]|uniref:Uncharacterized protein n=1 Tax=Rhizobium jaguaris TaxID=1312183 RepID=A0A387FQV2_9HYPH|nr:hypothetical protein CCGE525_01455 [Rhizobium jaguaris]